MSEIVTMRTDKSHRHGKSVIISGEKVSFDKLGFVDVMERHVEGLLKGGLEIVDEADLKKFAKQRELLEKADFVAPVIDLHDENAKLKVEVSNLKKENEVLKVALAKANDAVVSEKVDEDGKDIESKKEDKDSVDSLNKTELIELCKELEFPEKEWKNLKVDELKIYVKSKL